MSRPPSIDSFFTPEAIDRIAAFADPVIRNLQITQSYHELSHAMTARTALNATWCTYATWASKQAGQTIRREDIARVIENFLTTTPTAMQAAPDVITAAEAFGSHRDPIEIQDSVTDVLNPFAAFDRASDAVARGNQKVYAEIGREFARFCTLFLDDVTFDPEKIREFCGGLLPGDPPDGQRYLRQAFTRYYQAFFEADPKARAELLLLANIEIGLHEQTRLQPEIAEALDAAFLDRRQFRLRLLRALFPYRGWLARLRLFLLNLFNRSSPFDEALDRLLVEARRYARLVITEYVLTIELPGGVRLRLGEDVAAEFPDVLKQLVLPELCALLETIDRTPDSTQGSGAADWARLEDRMQFIADMFRCYHATAILFESPFTAEQVNSLKRGDLPRGRL